MHVSTIRSNRESVESPAIHQAIMQRRGGFIAWGHRLPSDAGWPFIPTKGTIVDYQFVTNNPRLMDKEGAIPVDGTFRDVLIKVRDMVHAGYELISHPLFASSRMMFSPFRSILVGQKMDTPRIEFIEIIENSIISYDNAMARRNRQPEHDDDYAYVDESLFYSALEEIERLRP